ncbi:MAG: hypothetical protein KA712_22975 [Myxococcales bacterium]|nr:hypothetical protein [Myxococcales bacterium]
MPRRIFEVSLAATAVALTCGMLLAPGLGAGVAGKEARHVVDDARRA